MKKTFLSILLLAATPTLAEPFNNPIQDSSLDLLDDGITMTSEPDWSEQFKKSFSLIRVKIFPHNSKYNAPHGKDLTMNQLTISSSGQCQIYRSEFPTSTEGLSRKFLLKTGNKFELTTTSVPQPIWIECSKPIEVLRPDFPTKPISYSGVLFIKTVNAESPYLTAVNVLPFEQYLKGVIPSEMPASWALEALKAQAIAARTYAYFELKTAAASRDKNIVFENSGAQLNDTVSYQAYLGLKNNTPATDLALEQTQGLVMTYQNRIIKAYFSADSGGHTESSENVWGDFHPYTLGKPEIYPPGSVPGSDWSLSVSLADLGVKLITAGYLPAGSELISLSIDPTQMYPSTRPKFVELKLRTGKVIEISAVNFAFAAKLKSSWIQFSPAPEAQNLTITGKGYGHGVGMSQWGARIMADQLQKSYDEILNFYYTDIKISL